MSSITKSSPAISAKSWQCLSATSIKLIAIVLMFIDHIHEMFVSMGAPMWLNLLGRPVFPLFLFLAADSFHYTHSRKNYMTRLLIASWCMTIITTTVTHFVPNDAIVLANNAFSTFFVTTVYMLAWDVLRRGVREKNPLTLLKGLGIALLPVISTLPMMVFGQAVDAGVLSEQGVQIAAVICLMIPSILMVEGGPLYVLMGLLFYMFRERRAVQIAIAIAFGIFFYAISGGIQWGVALAAIPMLFYSGAKGRGMKYFFYVFYPTHIVTLYLLATFIMNR